MEKNATIAAIATPMGSGGIGIVKISGPEAFNITFRIFQRSGKNLKNPVVSTIKPRYLYHGHVLNPRTGQELDEVLVAFMEAPHSYTREDVVEIQAHAGSIILKSIMELVIEEGAIIAEPGEFTKRAFLNGRIDLTQAEAVADIINANSSASLDIAASQLKGELKKRINIIRHELIDMLARLEALLDFPDDTEEIGDVQKFRNRLEHSVIHPLTGLIECYESSHFLRDGVKLVIAGSPNVGKSSLMNRLVKKDRAIVTPIPGTTRDLIEDIFTIQGIPVIVIDTAGIHSVSRDPVEKIGIEKAMEQINQADMVLFVVDASEKFRGDQIHQLLTSLHSKIIIIFNKIDLLDQDVKIDRPAEYLNDFPCAEISALYNTGIDDLIKLMGTILMGESISGSTIVPNIRHTQSFEKALGHANAAKEALNCNLPFELVSIDMRGILDQLDEIIGITIKPDILDAIFNNFCIGK